VKPCCNQLPAINSHAAELVQNILHAQKANGGDDCIIPQPDRSAVRVRACWGLRSSVDSRCVITAGMGRRDWPNVGRPVFQLRGSFPPMYLDTQSEEQSTRRYTAVQYTAAVDSSLPTPLLLQAPDSRLPQHLHHSLTNRALLAFRSVATVVTHPRLESTARPD
jgi:hypothetical protein